jgi:hypothetical protein
MRARQGGLVVGIAVLPALLFEPILRRLITKPRVPDRLASA